MNRPNVASIEDDIENIGDLNVVPENPVSDDETRSSFSSNANRTAQSATSSDSDRSRFFSFNNPPASNDDTGVIYV